jgi:hypothetical protein
MEVSLLDTRWECTVLNSDVLRSNFWNILNNYLLDGWEPFAVSTDKFWLRRKKFIELEKFEQDLVDGKTLKEENKKEV